MPYSISDYSYQQAKKLDVDIKPSTNPKKKIDVFKAGKKITSIGASEDFMLIKYYGKFSNKLLIKLYIMIKLIS